MPDATHQPPDVEPTCLAEGCSNTPEYHVKVDTGGDMWYDCCHEHLSDTLPDSVKGGWEWTDGDVHV